MRYPQFDKARFQMDDLLSIMALLRSEDGCPWDREQTHDSIRKNLIEETYEVLDALDQNAAPALREELGDLLLQIVFHTQMEQEAGHFDFEDVITELCQKLIVRHPHVFGDVTAETSSQVLKNWDAIKQQTKGQKTGAETLAAVPKNLPALMRATKLGHRAARAGMDFPDAPAAMERLQAESEELSQALAQADKPAVAEEIGDVLFSACNVARLSGIDAEEALTAASEKFIRRFEATETLAAETGQTLKDLTAQQKDSFWEQAKQKTEKPD